MYATNKNYYLTSGSNQATEIDASADFVMGYYDIRNCKSWSYQVEVVSGTPLGSLQLSGTVAPFRNGDIPYPAFCKFVGITAPGDDARAVITADVDSGILVNERNVLSGIKVVWKADAGSSGTVSFTANQVFHGDKQ